MTTARNKPREQGDTWESGIATTLGVIWSCWGEHGLVVMAMRELGVTYDTLRNNGAVPYDLKLIREAFKHDHEPLRKRKS